MTAAIYGIVLFSTVLHAYWNFLLKRDRGGAAFVGLSKVAEVVVFAPVFVWTMVVNPPSMQAAPILIAVGAALVLVNYAALARAYALTDLSFAYPVSRAGALLFLPPLAFLVFGERLSLAGIVAMTLIIIGMVVMQLPRLSWDALTSVASKFADAGAIFALVAALAAATYTVWDKRAINQLPAFVYFYAYTAIVAAAYLAFLLRRSTVAELREEWQAKRWSIVQVGVFNTLTYLIVLFALRVGTSSYVIAVRQLSIVWGVLLGRWLLGEEVATSRRVGVGLLIAGCALVAVSR